MKSVALPNSPARALQPRAPWRWAIIGAAIGLVVAFVLFAPAAWVARGVHHWSGGQMWLHETSGTWWQGSARVALTSGPTGTDRTRLPGRLHWRLTPGWSSGPDAEAGLRGPLARLRVEADCCTREPLHLAAAAAGLGARIRLQGPTSVWPAAMLAGLGTPWNTLEPDGEVRISAPGPVLTLGQGRWSLQGAITLEAREMSTRLSTLRPMGSYRLELRGGDVPLLALETLEPSSLRLEGEGRWVGNRLRFLGSASAADGRVEALSNLLNIIGRRDGARSIIQLG